MNIKLFFEKLSLPSFDAEGYPLIGVALLLVLIGALISKFILLIGVALLIYAGIHFQKPKRVAPEENDKNIIAPVDGIIDEIENVSVPDGFPEAGQAAIRIRIRSSFFDSPMFYTPISGLVYSSALTAKPLFARAELAEERGEKQYFAIDGTQKIHNVVSAPLLGKKFLTETANGKSLTAGEKLGMGRIVSIYDLFLPANNPLKMLEGQRLVGGETIIAQLKDAKKNSTSSAKSNNSKKDSSVTESEEENQPSS